MDDAALVKERIDIVAIIGEYVRLVRAGRNFKGLCPFHEERTPSFMVSPELQIFKCFGCGESGDVYTFLQKHEGMDFYEALKYLAERAGIKLKPRRTADVTINSQIIEANRLAAKFYHYILTKHALGRPGLDYLIKKRGINAGTIEKFELGFAPSNKSILFNTLTKKNVKGEILEKAGLVFKTDRGCVDRFRERVIFPIHNHRGETIALAGRILPEYDNGRSGKYINSPETPVYHKSTSLYGLNITKEEIRKTRKAVVVEGEFDFLSSWQAGVKNIVAIKGTALTIEHVRILARFADSLIMALDSDFAGDTAAIRGLGFAQNSGLEVRVADLGKFKDPDEFARADPDGYKLSLKNSLDAWDFVISVAVKRFDLTTGAGKAKASRQIVPIISTIEDGIVRAHYAQKTAIKLGVPLDSVLSEVEKRGVTKIAVQKVEEKRPIKTRRELLEERLLAISINKPDILDDNIEDYLLTPLNLKIAREIKKYPGSEKINLSEFGKSLPPELKDGFATLVMQDFSDSSREVEMVKKELKELVLKEKLTELSRKIALLEEKGDKKELTKLQKEFILLSRNLSEITKN